MIRGCEALRQDGSRQVSKWSQALKEALKRWPCSASYQIEFHGYHHSLGRWAWRIPAIQISNPNLLESIVLSTCAHKDKAQSTEDEDKRKGSASSRQGCISFQDSHMHDQSSIVALLSPCGQTRLAAHHIKSRPPVSAMLHARWVVTVAEGRLKEASRC